MYLIDSSVLIDYFRNIENRPVIFFDMINREKLPYGITSVIYQEVLQGAASEKDYQLIKSCLSTQQFFHPQDNLATYEAAAFLYYKCRRQGITIRSTIDCLISQICIEHQLVLVHHDVDYRQIQTIAPELQLFDQSKINRL